MLARRSLKRPLVRKREKLNWRSPHSHGVMVVDPRASAWKTHRCPAGLSGRSGLMILTLPTIGVRRTKTRLRTLMIPLSPLMGLSQVLPRPLWPPVPPVPPPKRPSDRWGVFHSVTPSPLLRRMNGHYQVTTCLISLVYTQFSSSMLITFSPEENVASDYGSSDSLQPSFLCVLNKVFMLLI